MAEYIAESIRAAGKGGARFVVIQMDTPGGMVDSMREIIKAIMTSEIPVVVYAYPRGAQAASAGGYIMLAAHVAAMAPGTEIGAMHPVSPLLDFMPRDQRGDPAGAMEKKILNDMTAFAKSLAQKRGRNVEWAERAVKRAESSTYMDALRAGVIDIVAEDMNDLMAKLDGRKVPMNGAEIVMRTANLVPRPVAMTWKQKFVNFFADPQMMLILLILAVAGIGLEIKSPGIIVPGVVGGIALFLFLMAARILPVNIAGILLIALAIILFILELKFTSYGLLTIGGIASFLFGSMILFDSPLPGGNIPFSTIAALLVVVLAFVFLVVRAVLRAVREQVTTGKEGMIGLVGEAMGDFTVEGKGKIMVRGEIWNAKSEDVVSKGDEVIVQDIRGMELQVKKV